MPREIVLGNGKLLVNIDKWLQVRDIYFPHVGQYNHLLGHAHKMGILEKERISWINEDGWEKSSSYQDDTLVTKSVAKNPSLNLEIEFNENVYCEKNIFFRKIKIKNLSKSKRKIRFFFHQDFHLYSEGIGDTALYHPKYNSLIHYKKSSYFLLGLCSMEHKNIITDYDIDKKVFPGYNLKKNPISQGEVDSIMCTDIELEANKEYSFCYYMAAGKDFSEVFSLAEEFLNLGIKKHLVHSAMCQRGWLGKISIDLSTFDKEIQDLYKRSLLIIKTQIDKDGAIIAANDSDIMQFNKDTYSYMWPRDGALTAITLIKSGFFEETKPFFEFCRDVLYEEGCLLQKYNPNKTLGSSWHPWVLHNTLSLPIQEDETALVLYALKVYYDYTKDEEFIKKLYSSLIKPMGEFLSNYRYENGLPKESYDLWEEKRAIFTYTTSTVIAGLKAGEELGMITKDKKFCDVCQNEQKRIKNAMTKYLYNKEKGYFRKGVSFEEGKIINDEAMDSSVYALFEFDILKINDKKLVSTMNKMKEWLEIKTNIGGFSRYYDDNYQRVSQDINSVPGNPWIICTLWYAKYLIKKANKIDNLKEALSILKWVTKNASKTGILPEQLNPYTGEHLSVSPLTWSHAEFVGTVNDYANKIKELNKK